MSDPAWKQTERWCATTYGHGRVLEQSRGGGPDFYFRDDVFLGKRGEVKHRRTLPRWLHSALAKSDVTFVFERYKKRGDGFVLMRVSAFDELIGRFKEVSDDE